ncbi:MAG: hypothetical protein AAGG57_08910 [Pseudomonadota bacterium]
MAACDIQPKPLGQDELLSIAQGRPVDVVPADHELVQGAIGLYEAMARALKYNLDRQVELKEEACAGASCAWPTPTCCPVWWPAPNTPTETTIPVRAV